MFIFGFIALKIWTILNIFTLKFGVYFWVHCIEDMDNFYVGPNTFILKFGVMCVRFFFVFVFLWVLYCIEDMDNNSYHRSTLPLSYFWVWDRSGEWRRRPNV